jgi:hypothetical protein
MTGGQHGERPNEKQQGEEEAEGKQKEACAGAFALYLDGSERNARRRAEEDLLTARYARAAVAR